MTDQTPTTLTDAEIEVLCVAYNADHVDPLLHAVARIKADAYAAGLAAREAHTNTPDAAPAPTDNQSWFREEYARAKERNDQTPPHARMIVTNPELSAHQPAPTDNQHNNTLKLLAADWRLLRYHHPVGANHPVGQLDGDCSCGRGAWPCHDVLRAVVDGPTTPTQETL